MNSAIIVFMKKFMTILSIITLITILLLVVAFNLYSLAFNKTNHTGFDTHILIKAFSALFISWLGALIYFKYKKRDYNYIFFFLILLFGLIGIINVVLFEKFNVMMKYELWIDKGMPDSFSERSDFFEYLP